MTDSGDSWARGRAYHRVPPAGASACAARAGRSPCRSRENPVQNLLKVRDLSGNEFGDREADGEHLRARTRHGGHETDQRDRTWRSRGRPRWRWRQPMTRPPSPSGPLSPHGGRPRQRTRRSGRPGRRRLRCHLDVRQRPDGTLLGRHPPPATRRRATGNRRRRPASGTVRNIEPRSARRLRSLRAPERPGSAGTTTAVTRSSGRPGAGRGRHASHPAPEAYGSAPAAVPRGREAAMAGAMNPGQRSGRAWGRPQARPDPSPGVLPDSGP